MLPNTNRTVNPMTLACFIVSPTKSLFADFVDTASASGVPAVNQWRNIAIALTILV
jgi:hypothetical protein